MVTLKRLPSAALRAGAARVLQGAASAAPPRGGVLQGAASAVPLPPFSAIATDTGAVIGNAVTIAFEREIAAWAGFWRCVESATPHVVMPDHLHLLVKLAKPGPQTRPGAKPITLSVLVGDLKKRLRRVYWQVLQGAASAAPPRGGVLQGAASAAPWPELFAEGFHDWIVKREGQLAAFRAYIRDNGPRAALRSRKRQYFTKARKIAFQGARYWAYGNEALLSMTGFGERWHPSAKQEKLCAEGRMLYLCPWEPQEARLDKATMYKRAHHLVDWALEHTQERLEAWPI